MAKYPKMIYKKSNPSELQRVNRDRYYKRIHEGWGLVSAAKFAKRCRVLLEKMDMSFDQFWERILRVFSKPTRSKRWFREALTGRIDDSQVDFVLLHIVATAACQPISYFTQEKPLVPVYPWKHWALDQAARRARNIRIFRIEYQVEGRTGRQPFSAADEVQARSLWKERFPHADIISVTEVPAELGVAL